MKAMWYVCVGLLMLSALLHPDRAAGQAVAESAESGAVDQASSSSTVLALPVVPLEAGSDAPPLASYIRFVRNPEGDIATDNWETLAPNPSALNGSKIQFGPGGQEILVLLQVRNESSTKGTWLLSTKRGALKDFKLAERVDDATRLLIDGNNIPQVREILQSYHGFTHAFELEPGEQREFALSFHGVYSTLFPLSIQTSATFTEERYWNVAVAAGGFLGTLTVVFIGVIFYTATGRSEFLWLGMAELILAAYIVHVPGYSFFYFLYDMGNWVYAVGIMLPCAYALFAAQFARVFLKTAVNFPRFNRLLIGMMMLWTLVILRRIYMALIGEVQDGGLLGAITVFAVATAQIVLPIMAFLAVFRLSRHYWPLLVAWGGWALYNFYTITATLGYASGLPNNWHYTGIAALLTALFASLALALHIRRVHLDKLVYERGLNRSLQKQIEIQDDAIRLEREKASAIATISDQDNLIHASGHDSQQVLMALNSIVSVTDRMKSDKLPGNLGDMLKSSASYLQDIVSTTTSCAISGFENASLIALGRFRFEELVRPIEMIYRPLFVKKQITLEVDIRSDRWLVSDRALLARVLSNLLSNSLKFTHKGSVTLSARTDGGEAIIEVRDTGAGMDPGLLDRLTGSSEGRVKIEDSEGTGFGLISSRSIIARLYGELDIESQKDIGTVIAITLPLSRVEQPEQIDSNEMNNHARGIRLLDADKMSREEFEARKDCRPCNGNVQDHKQVVPVTHDSSASLRSWVGSFANLVLIKPLWTDMLDHPAVKNLRNRAHWK
ncbi:MAG: sensor histidine kinase [Pseudomonadota bacterium]